MPYGSRLDSQHFLDNSVFDLRVTQTLRCEMTTWLGSQAQNLFRQLNISFAFIKHCSSKLVALTTWADHVTKSKCLFFIDRSYGHCAVGVGGYTTASRLYRLGLAQSTKILRRWHKPHYGDCMIGLFRILTLCRECCRYLVGMRILTSRLTDIGASSCLEQWASFAQLRLERS